MTTTRSITYVWLILSAITVFSWWLAPAHGSGAVQPSVPITVAVVALGFVKGRLIVRHFMEVRAAPRWLKLATDGWLVALWGAVLVVYLW
jgi:hypothetical protein